ncbi:hypothetical protein [Helicobacter colisuis]|uniref:hypothetical protein n=1 Tax=Helicobacter colisuis TaxID=2949739 RepID=UPI00202A6879|nr:hypothetical protein [Helicobacter colisuis]MCL9822648.1 hypothetical protein [Helicobacter colisuis]
MNSVSGFGLILMLIVAVSFLIVVATIISVVRSGDKLTSFEKKILVFVAVALCLLVAGLYITSNLSLFLALIG